MLLADGCCFVNWTGTNMAEREYCVHTEHTESGQRNNGKPVTKEHVIIANKKGFNRIVASYTLAAMSGRVCTE